MKAFAATQDAVFPTELVAKWRIKNGAIAGTKEICKSPLSHNPAAITRGTKEAFTSDDGRERCRRVIPTSQNNPLTHKYQPAPEYQI